MNVILCSHIYKEQIFWIQKFSISLESVYSQVDPWIEPLLLAQIFSSSLHVLHIDYFIKYQVDTAIQSERFIFYELLLCLLCIKVCHFLIERLFFVLNVSHSIKPIKSFQFMWWKLWFNYLTLLYIYCKRFWLIAIWPKQNPFTELFNYITNLFRRHHYLFINKFKFFKTKGYFPEIYLFTKKHN